MKSRRSRASASPTCAQQESRNDHTRELLRKTFLIGRVEEAACLAFQEIDEDDLDRERLDTIYRESQAGRLAILEELGIGPF